MKALYLITVFAALALLNGCETISGSLYYIDGETGAKGGLNVRPAGSGWWIKLPYTDEDGSEGALELQGEIPVRAEK